MIPMCLCVCVCRCTRESTNEEQFSVRHIANHCHGHDDISFFLCLTNRCIKDGHRYSYGYPKIPGLDFCIYLISPPPCSPFRSLYPSFSPSSASSSPLIYQIASTRSQLSPIGGSFLAWISVKWTRGIGRQSMTLSRDEWGREWWAPRHRRRAEGQKFMLQMHLRSMIILPVVRPHDTYFIWCV